LLRSPRRGAATLREDDVNLLRAALLDGDVARASFRAWREHLDWEAVTVVWQRLMPLLDDNLRRLGVDDPLIRRFRGVRRYFWAKNLRRTGVAKSVFSAFDAAGLPVLGLKGISLIAGGYVDRSVRPMEDLDILVRPDDVEAATDLLDGLGYRPAWYTGKGFRRRAAELSGSPSQGFRNDVGDEVDLHWNIMHLDQRPDADRHAWETSRLVSFEGQEIRVLSPADQLLHSLEHGAQDLDARGLRWIADAAVIIRSTPDLDWPAFAEAARFHRLSVVTAAMLQQLVDVLGVNVPSATMVALARDASFGERLESRLLLGGAARTANPLIRIAMFRRRRGDLFERGLPSAVGPYLMSLTGAPNPRIAAVRTVYNALGQPRWLRRALVRDRDLALPAPDLLPEFGTTIDTASPDMPEAAFVHGWSVVEKGGRWTHGRSATIAWRCDPSAAAVTSISVLGWAVQLRMGMKVYANDVAVGRISFMQNAAPGPMTFDIPASALAGSPVLVLTFEINRPLVPAARGASIDTRPLGIHLQWIKFG
jgi:hypothetical protein